MRVRFGIIFISLSLFMLIELMFVPECMTDSVVKSVSAGSTHTLVLLDNGSVWAWGSNQYGQLGDGTTTDRLTPVEVCISNVSSICAGEYASYAVKDDGSVWAWGEEEYLQLGIGEVSEKIMPAPVRVPIDNVRTISAGGYTPLALKNDGTVWAWGFNNHGEAGVGTTERLYTPVQVRGLANIRMVASDSAYSMALDCEGHVWTWGGNGGGQLGDGTYGEETNAGWLSPKMVNISNVKYIACGGCYSLAVKDDGTVWAWGMKKTENGFTYILEPEQIPISNIVCVDGGQYHVTALDTNGNVWCWGQGGMGMLGQGPTKFYSDVPLKVEGLGKIIDISVCDKRNFALGEDGSVYAWGSNYHGDLGDGTMATRYYPVRIIEGSATNTQNPSASAMPTVNVTIQGTVFGKGLTAYELLAITLLIMAIAGGVIYWLKRR